MKKEKKNFLNLPQYLGDKEDLQKFVSQNLVYPEKAKQERTEGIVYLSAEIDDNGHVTRVDIIKGLPNGCNEEAIRVVKNFRFGGVTNKGVRVKTTKRFRIQFKLPAENKITYQLVNKPGKTESSPKSAQKYSYSITFSNNQ